MADKNRRRGRGGDTVGNATLYPVNPNAVRRMLLSHASAPQLDQQADLRLFEQIRRNIRDAKMARSIISYIDMLLSSGFGLYEPVVPGEEDKLFLHVSKVTHTQLMMSELDTFTSRVFAEKNTVRKVEALREGFSRLENVLRVIPGIVALEVSGHIGLIHPAVLNRMSRIIAGYDAAISQTGEVKLPYLVSPPQPEEEEEEAGEQP